ncbi:oligoendopeptidase F [Deinococcus soli (ex Cha et al. 2016)]|uniref:Oligoendopeptidase F n=2 Tax=Deinococcus soli (ex Cha et al. 2016) TaxID=1309411 RepID=A0ACC6KDS3_9DEIO|nr:oligoendopeptidase F [Deinococcus soli (ex Cha et al. 2016)]MDR6217350.1 oligoendopeptidase F [Deinococcus soli (ex Cha et al. 2016)]MDR6326659.1 oligoendopeptidase F [Deinococcus soli (ex Cha et al. 2016)]MDR6750614.1 oligoendopeptidase F [Deinococcus soli (ex Cha et al. 2016)]
MPTETIKALPPRSDVPREQTWDIEALYDTPDAWSAEGDALARDLPALSAHAGQLGTPGGLLAYLRAANDLELRLGRFMSYASMTASVDGRDAVAAARRDRASTLGAQFGSAAAFFRPELLALDDALVRGWLDTPDFAEHRVRLERILRGKPHVRSAEVEELLGAVQAPFASERGIHPALANMDLRFGTAGGETVTQGNVDRLTAHPEREVRREAWEGYADAHLAARHSQAAMYATNVRQNVFLARARNYPDTISASLSPDNIPTAVVTTLLDTYRANTPVWHRYWRVRREWLGLPELREYDVKAALVPPRAVSYEQAVQWLEGGMAALGADYVRDMVPGLTTERWVDYAENDGKRQGAYSNGGGRVKPYIFMTWNGTMNSYSTLAHEIGHSMHSLLSQREHGYGVPRYTLFHAEVASNFNQAMVRQHLLAQARAAGDTEFEVQIIEEALSNFHRYFFIMPTLAAFELEAYRRIEAGGTLSAPDLITLTADLLSKGYGDGVTMDRERSGILWAQFSTHLYANFYAYQYSTGISAAHQILEQFTADPDAARESYLRFLRSGGSLDPIDALREAGVDMLSPAPVEATFRTLEGYVARLEELLAARR